MADIALEFDHVWKKFSRAEMYDSLRDLIPALMKRSLNGRKPEELKTKEFWAVKDVSFQVRKGEVLGIIGNNGAGKSTILKLLSGILRPNRGKITCHGRMSALIEVGAGFHPDLTGRENVYLNGAILGMRRKEIDKKFEEIVEFAGISEFIDTPVKRYSSGMFARLGFSVAAHVDPDILLVDEVLSVGDLSFQQKCIEKMVFLRGIGVPIVFISHNLQAVQMLCSKAMLLNLGQVATFGSVENVLRDYQFRSYKTTETDGYSLLSDVTLCDDCGLSKTGFQAGDRARLNLTVRTRESFDEYVLGFLIRRATDNFLVCDYNLPLSSLGGSNEHSGTGQRAIIDFRVNLLRGLYTITLHLYHKQSQRHVFWAAEVAGLAVEERMSWEGVSHVNPSLQRVDDPANITTLRFP